MRKEKVTTALPHEPLCTIRPGNRGESVGLLMTPAHLVQRRVPEFHRGRGTKKDDPDLMIRAVAPAFLRPPTPSTPHFDSSLRSPGAGQTESPPRAPSCPPSSPRSADPHSHHPASPPADVAARVTPRSAPPSLSPSPPSSPPAAPRTPSRSQPPRRAAPRTCSWPR